MTKFLLFVFIIMSIGCQIVRFDEPYGSQADSKRSAKSEGLIGTLHSGLLNGLSLMPPSASSNIEMQQPLYATQCEKNLSSTQQNRLLKMQEQLQKSLVQQGVSLRQEENIVFIPLTTQRFFLLNSPRLSNRIFPVLDSLTNSLSHYPDLLITLGVGHLHNPDSDESVLTSFRIRSVEHYFNRFGFNAERIFNVNNGDELPLSAEQITASKTRYNNKSQIILALCFAGKYR